MQVQYVMERKQISPGTIILQNLALLIFFSIGFSESTTNQDDPEEYGGSLNLQTLNENYRFNNNADKMGIIPIYENLPDINSNQIQMLLSHYYPLEPPTNYQNNLMPREYIWNNHDAGFPESVLPPFCDKTQSTSNLSDTELRRRNKLLQETMQVHSLNESNILARQFTNNQPYFNYPQPFNQAQKLFLPYQLHTNHDLYGQELSLNKFQNFPNIQENFLRDLLLSSNDIERANKRFMRNSVKSNVRQFNGKNGKINKLRKMRSIPLSVKKFHLMHGIYKENEEMMINALEKAHQLAKSIGSNTQYFDEEEAFPDDMINNSLLNYPLQLGLKSQIKGQPKKRRILLKKRRDDFRGDTNESLIQRYWIIVADLQNELRKKLSEVEQLNETINNIQSIQKSLFINDAPKLYDNLSQENIKEIKQSSNSKKMNNSSVFSEMYPPAIIEVPDDHVDLQLKGNRKISDLQLENGKFDLQNDHEFCPQFSYTGDLVPYSSQFNEEIGNKDDEGHKEIYLPDADPLNFWINNPESSPSEVLRKKRFLWNDKLLQKKLNITNSVLKRSNKKL